MSIRPGPFIPIGYRFINMTVTPVRSQRIQKHDTESKTTYIRSRKTALFNIPYSKRVKKNYHQAIEPKFFTDRRPTISEHTSNSKPTNCLDTKSTKPRYDELTYTNYLIPYRIILSWTIYINWASLHQNDAYACWISTYLKKTCRIQNHIH